MAGRGAHCDLPGNGSDSSPYSFENFAKTVLARPLVRRRGAGTAGIIRLNLPVMANGWMGSDVRRLITVFSGLALLWAGGLFVFIAKLPAPSQTAPINAEGIAVYTGGGGVRISSAMAIFADGAGERLLISGVHPNTSAAHLSKFWVGAQDRFDCCVDLGREALTTEGNAGELSAWAETHRYKNIILVTSEYHMPRAMMVTRAQMPDATLKPHAVASGYLDEKGRPASFEAGLKLAGEYTKFLLARLKALIPATGQ